MTSATLYDRIGVRYKVTRGEDPHLAGAIWNALGQAETVLNVGAGTGSYEPRDRAVVAVEPSQVMIRQRPADAAPVVQARAEALPFPDNSFDVAMAILSDHHWTDRRLGLRELHRVALKRVVIFNWDARHVDRFWLTRDYLPIPLPPMDLARSIECLAGARVQEVPIPADCRDGFFHAFWARPEAYLDPQVRAGTSIFVRVGERRTSEMVRKLHADLESGTWDARYGPLRRLPELDLGYRLVIKELP